MKLNLLRSYRDKFKEHLEYCGEFAAALNWECQEIFQEKWDIDAIDFAKMYDTCLSHQKSGRLWGGNHQSAKSAMLVFINNNSEFVRSMFRDLFSEKKDLIMRIERFQFHCDQLLHEVHKTNHSVIHHDHDDFYMPTLYLSMRYPQVYCLFEKEPFSMMLGALEAKDSGYVTLERFQKVTHILQSQLLQDNSIKELLRKRVKLQTPDLYASKWLTFEFYHFVARTVSKSLN